MFDKSVCDKGHAWNPSNCEWECDKSCDVGECLDYENCKCRKRLVEYTENTKKYTVCIVLAVIALTVSIGIGAYLAYKYINRNEENVSKNGYVYQATNY